MIPSAPDPETFAAAVRGDDAAWAVLHRQWAPVVLSWCSYLGGGRIDADEAARDVFFRLWQKAERVRSPAVFRSFLYSVTRRVVSEHRRRAWGRRWVGAPTHERPDTRRGPAQLTEERAIAAQVQDVLGSLRDRDREVLLLCEVMGHTTQEAADIIGIPPNTVKSRLLRARKRFAEIARRRDLAPELLSA